MLQIKALETNEIKLLLTHMGASFVIPLNFEMLDSSIPYNSIPSGTWEQTMF